MFHEVISVVNVSKKYLIGKSRSNRYVALRDVFSNVSVKKIFNFFRRKLFNLNNQTEEFWALKDISFKVSCGERVGIIGRNGAGKSTLLKLLSRITDVTDGSIKIKGRVASLLEVGTGFHPELTGRENIFLNAAILGMSKKETKEKFQQIVDFAEIEAFLDTPVKRYSSGMYVRLAFSVAAHLDPDILIVDEVLAVGDAAFQAKCLSKMEEKQSEGRTILFVSHNIGAIQNFCTRAIVLNRGEIYFDGETKDAIHAYLESISLNQELTKSDFVGPWSSIVQIQNFKVNDASGMALIRPSEDVTFTMLGTAIEHIEKIRFSVAIMKDGIRLFTLHDMNVPQPLVSGQFAIHIVMPKFVLRPGTYTVGIGANDSNVYSGSVNWMYANEISSFCVVEEWGDENDYSATGIVNIQSKGHREIH